MRRPELLRFTEDMLQQKSHTRPLLDDSMTGKSDLILVTSMAVIAAIWWLLL